MHTHPALKPHTTNNHQCNKFQHLDLFTQLLPFTLVRADTRFITEWIHALRTPWHLFGFITDVDMHLGDRFITRDKFFRAMRTTGTPEVSKPQLLHPNGRELQVCDGSFF